MCVLCVVRACDCVCYGCDCHTHHRAVCCCIGTSVRKSTQYNQHTFFCECKWGEKGVYV